MPCPARRRRRRDPDTGSFADLGANLARNAPPKWDKKSWKKLADSFSDSSTKMDEAAQKEELAGTKDAYKTVSGSCMACHKAHKK